MARQQTALRDTTQAEPVLLPHGFGGEGNNSAPALYVPAIPASAGKAEPCLTQNPMQMGALKPLQQITDPKRGLLSTMAACAGHAILVFALIYAAGAAGQFDQEAETPVEIEIVIESAAQAAPEIAAEPVINVELPPPLPDPVIELPEHEPAPVADAPPEPPEQQPEVTFQPPPPAQAAEPVLPLPKPAPLPPKIDLEKQRLREDLLRKQRGARLLHQQQQTREEARKAAREKARETARQQARAAARLQSAQPQAALPASPPSAGTRSDNSVNINAFKSAVAARIARNKPAGSTAAAAQGTVVVAFSVTASGAAAGVRIASSSGHGVLDQAALSAVRRASPFPAPPPGAPRSFSVPMRFNAQ